MIIFVQIFSCILLFSGNINSTNAQKGIWVTGEGEVILESTMMRDYAIAEAVNKARKNAIIKVPGIDITNSIFIMNSSNDPVTRAEEFTRATVQAKIICKMPGYWRISGKIYQIFTNPLYSLHNSFVYF